MANQYTATGLTAIKTIRFHPTVWAAVERATKLGKAGDESEWVRNVVEAALVRKKLLSNSPEAVRKRAERARAARAAELHAERTTSKRRQRRRRKAADEIKAAYAESRGPSADSGEVAR